MGRFLGLTMAPLCVPAERRTQTALVMYYVVSLFLLPLFGSFLLVYLLLRSTYWYVGLLYSIWMYVDSGTPESGGRSFDWLRNFRFWQTYRDYFPMSLRKTADLDPTRNYILGYEFCTTDGHVRLFSYHPHGIIATGTFGNFVVWGGPSDFVHLFPGLDIRISTLNVNFWWPFARDWWMAHGMVSASKRSLLYLLTQMGVGNAVVLVVGGAQEAFETRPNEVVLNLANRKGFVKVALTAGADLVPVFSFGENQLYLQTITKKGSSLRCLQETIKKYTTISPILFHGRGIFNYTFGILPFRRPIEVVVGKPIRVEKTKKPTQAAIDELHEKYVAELLEVFHAHKGRHGFAEHVQLHIH